MKENGLEEFMWRTSEKPAESAKNRPLPDIWEK